VREARASSRAGLGLALSSAAVALVTAASAGRQAPAAQAPVFRAGVQLISVDVRVLDRAGKPVPGLTAADFTVKVDGATRPVRLATFREAPDRLAAAPVVSSATDSRTTTNILSPAAVEAAKGRSILFLVDDLSHRATSTDLHAVRSSLERLLKSIAPADRIGVATTSGMGRAVAPTTDRAEVAAALRTIAGQYEEPVANNVYMSFDEAYDYVRNPGSEGSQSMFARECGILRASQIECETFLLLAARTFERHVLQRTAWQLRAYESIIKAMGLAPAPRILVVVSDGIAAGSGAALEGWAPLQRAAADAGIQLYAVTGVQDDLMLSEQDQGRADAKSQERASFQRGVENFTSAVGGRTIRLTGGRADAVFDRILTETSGYYELGVELPPDNKKRYLSTEVKVVRSGLTVFANHRAVARNIVVAPATPEAALRRTVQRGIAEFGVPITLATSLRRDANRRGVEVGVHVEVPGSVPGPLRAMFALVNEAGLVVRLGEADIPTGTDRHQTSFPLAMTPGAYRLRFGVADRNGSIGSVERALAARLTPMGGWLTSDLQSSWVDGAGSRRFLALEEVPEGAREVGVSLEFYASDPAVLTRRTRVRFELVGPAGGPIELRDVSLDGAADSRAASLSVPVARWAPGVHVFRATVFEQDIQTGALSLAVRAPAGWRGADAGVRPAAAVVSPASRGAGAPGSAASVLTVLSTDASTSFGVDLAPLVARRVVQPHLVAMAAGRDALPAAVSDATASDDAFWAGVSELDRAASGITGRSLTGGSAWLSRAVAAIRARDGAAALAAAERALEIAPSSLGAMLYFGAAHALAGRGTEAVGVWHLAISDAAAGVEWHVATSDALGRLGDLPGARAVALEAARKWPDAIEVRRRLGQHALARREFEAARAELSRVVEQAPADEVALFWLTALAYADTLEPGAAPAAGARFRELAGRYLKTGGSRGETVERWLSAR
jgi:VWFA-related protein